MDTGSQERSLKSLREELCADVSVYLHKTIPIQERGKAAMLKPNTPLTKKILDVLTHLHGESMVITIGYAPIDLATGPSVKRAAIIKSLISIVREETQKPTPALFVNRSALLMGTKEAETVFEIPPASVSEQFLIRNIPPLQKARANGIPGTRFTRALTDCLCAICLEILNEKKLKCSDDEEYEKMTSLILAAILKDYADVVPHSPPASAAPGQDLHSAISVHLLRGGSTSISAKDLLPDTFDFRSETPILSDSFRSILDHENPFTKSRIAQMLLRGMAFSEWLLSRKDQGGFLPREYLQKLGYFKIPEVPHVLKLMGLMLNGKAKALLLKNRQTSSWMRIIMMSRYLEANGISRPVALEKELAKHFVAMFSQFPDYHPVGFQELWQTISLENELHRLGMHEKKRKSYVADWEKRLHVILE